jgi:hypothetical protein
LGQRSLSKLIGDPQVGQNDRRAPAEDCRTMGAMPVKRHASLGRPTQVVKGDEVARRQLSQWQWPHQIGAPVNSNVTAPHRQWPLVTLIASS